MSTVFRPLLVLSENPQVGDRCPCPKEKLSNKNGCQFSLLQALPAQLPQISVAYLPGAGHTPHLSTLYGRVCPTFPLAAKIRTCHQPQQKI